MELLLCSKGKPLERYSKGKDHIPEVAVSISFIHLKSTYLQVFKNLSMIAYITEIQNSRFVNIKLIN